MFKKKSKEGNSPVVQWLGLQASTARDLRLILVGELRPHKLCGADKIKTERMVKMVKKNLKRQLTPSEYLRSIQILKYFKYFSTSAVDSDLHGFKSQLSYELRTGGKLFTHLCATVSSCMKWRR